MQAARLNIFALFIEPWRFFNPFGIEEGVGGTGGVARAQPPATSFDPLRIDYRTVVSTVSFG
jgi:hypothetical protein